MFYIAWVIVVIMVALWKRELRDARTAYINILGELKSERLEFDKLREKYMILLKEQGVRTGNTGKLKTRAASLNSDSK
ncbi:hypothetical protein [Candidatus Magnetominusculus xianensis]|uniref:Uncharacterized protein n=1 Tax=Candidatus Magnetominusculus xianensis TaxID=1748249 RepID=A0ABR5SER7_9BACT|nr:hypothetical protein [Candidatus Magnetominusculus xianensis]KWT82085.1 hypothetical protein ASN18_2534 [Candidatus Magnetominusculus xianensis]MBF0405470.1 hypothetical protein [Nitrospirota bacterium]